MSINSRNKGATFERKIAKVMKEATGFNWARTPGSGAFATRTGINSLQGDIFCEEEFPYLIECKAYEKIPLHLFAQELKSCLIRKWLTKLAGQCDLAGKQGLLIFKENRGKIMAMYEVQEFNKKENANFFVVEGRIFQLKTLDMFIKEVL